MDWRLAWWHPLHTQGLFLGCARSRTFPFNISFKEHTQRCHFHMYEGGWWFLTGLVYVNEILIVIWTSKSYVLVRVGIAFLFYMSMEFWKIQTWLPEIYGIWSFACLGLIGWCHERCWIFYFAGLGCLGGLMEQSGIPHYFLWCLWRERNAWTFEGCEKSS